MGPQVWLVDGNWRKTFDESIAGNLGDIRIICPFIQRRVVESLLKTALPPSLLVITRFCLSDFCDGVSSISALKVLLEHGAIIRGVKNLHAKMYIFDTRRAIVTSANLTDAALDTNHEAGFVTDDPDIVRSCTSSFSKLWARSGHDLTLDRLSDWERDINEARRSGLLVATGTALRDEGTSVGADLGASQSPLLVTDAGQAFVKFWGESHKRKPWTFSIFDEVERSGCHWACSYPSGKRPRQAKDGDVMYMGRMVSDPTDIAIFGRAIALAYVRGRDDATPEDIAMRSFKSDWPHYIRVYNGEFLEGTMANGVSLNEMMEDLGSDSFESTQRNARVGHGNTNPRTAYRQQAAVLLSARAKAWIDERLQKAFAIHGMIPAARLAQLDWPTRKIS